ncbi:MAG TPA: SRPBCC family protein, partial [Flavitalea sp.]|nr:SRPBCC family protein [Flavitalea sp.]
MPFIHLTTFIAAPQERVFDLARSINLHRDSMKKYDEKILQKNAGNLLELNDSITWSARHLFKTRVLSVKITRMKSPEYFVDEQTGGDFLMMKHEHYFKPIENGTFLIDQFHFETPYGSIGKAFNTVYL